MSIFKSTAAWLMAAIVFGLSTPLFAGPGHDHGEAAPSVQGAALPRFSAESDLFEIVGIVNGKQVSLYLDRFADNSPVNDAQIEVDINGIKLKAQAHGDGEYELNLSELLKPGVMAVTVAVTAGAETDLLAAELDLHEAPSDEARGRSWLSISPWLGGALVVLLVVLAFFLRQRAQRTAL